MTNCDKETESDTYKVSGVTAYADSLHHISFSDTIGGYEVTAVFNPYLADSVHSGQVTYTLKDALGEQTISCGYDNFFNEYETGECSCKLQKSPFTDFFAKNETVPFKLMDVDFDGIREFLVVYEGFCVNYYDVYKKDALGKFRKMDIPPYNKLMNGYDTKTTLNSKDKILTVEDASGPATVTEVYQVSPHEMEKGLQFVEKNYELSLGDSIYYSKWKMVGNKLQVVSEKRVPMNNKISTDTLRDKDGNL